MPTYKVTDPNTGKTIKLTPESGGPPSEQELEEIFSAPQGAIVEPNASLGQYSRSRRIPDSPSSPFSGIPQGIVDDPVGFAGAVSDEIAAESPALATAAGTAALTAPFGPVVQIPAVAASVFATKMAQQGIEQGMLKSGLIEEGDKLVSNAPITEKELPEVFDESLKTGGLFGAFEAIAPIAKVLKGGERLSGSVSADQRAALDFAKKEGAPTPSLAKVTEANLPDVAENFTRAGLFAGGRFLKLESKAKNFVDDFIGNLTGRFKPSAETIGEATINAIEGGSKAFNDGPVKILFNLTRDAFKGAPVKIASVQSSIRGVLPRLKDILTSGDGLALIKRMEAVKPRTNPNTGMIENVMTFPEAQEMRSEILSIIRKEKALLGGKVSGKLKFIEQELEREIVNTASAVDKASGSALTGVTVQGGKPIGAEALFRRANDFFKNGINLFNSKLISTMVKESPDIVANKITTRLSGKPVVIKNMRSAVRDKGAWNELQDHVMSTLVESATKNGEVSVNSLRTAFKKFGGKNGDALRQMFPDGRDKAMLKAINYKDIFLRKQPDSTGRFGSQIGQIGAAQAVASGGLFMTGHNKSAIGILLLPPVMARVLTSPWFVKFMTSPAGRTANPTIFMARATALLKEHGIEDFEFANKEGESSRSPFSGIADFFTGDN